MTVSIDDLRSGFAAPPPGSAPMMRWWWFGPSVDRAELDRELTAMQAAGIGGVEVSYVYPLDAGSTPLLSHQFLADLRYAADRARELGLRFDLTLGSGWSFGGPHITADLAARCLHWDRREIQPGPLAVPVVSAWPGDQLVAAYVGSGSIQEQPDDWTQLAVVDQMIMVPAGAGPRQVLIASSRVTGQNVKRAAAGAEGPVLDHYRAAATRAHLREFGNRLLDAVPAELLGSVFCDSLEVYAADWTTDLPAEFARRRGYDLLPRLPWLAVDGPGAAELRADHHQTLTELYQDHFVEEMQRWAAGRGVPFRIQGYGTPPATVSSYRFADLFEGEGWGWTEITQTRWATSAAHLYGRDVVSSETWTWVHSPSFRATPLDLKGEAHEHLLAGINQLIGHGWPYSPTDAPGLGWFFYAAGALDDRNPWWPAMPLLCAYLSRLCWLMRQGQPVADVLVYVPNRDVHAQMGTATGGSLDAWRETVRRLGDDVPRIVRQGGWDYDLFDDDAIDVLDPDQPRTVVVSHATMVPPRTRAWLEQVVSAGGSVIMIDSAIEISGSIPSGPSELAAVLTTVVAPDLDLSTGSSDLGFVHRRVDDTDVYLVINTGPRPLTATATPRTTRQRYEQWDPDTARLVGTGVPAGGVGIELDPYQATVLIMTDQPPTPGVMTEAPKPMAGRRVALDQDWTVTFGDGETVETALPHAWDDEPARRGWSGAATYTTTVDLTDPKRAVLDFGPTEVLNPGSLAATGMRGNSYQVMIAAPVREIAEVRVNGVACGTVWAPPYVVEIGSALRPGRNEIEVVVHNTAANRLATDEVIVELAEQSEREHGRRFRMQELDRALVGVRSGLVAVPAIVFTD